MLEPVVLMIDKFDSISSIDEKEKGNIRPYINIFRNKLYSSKSTENIFKRVVLLLHRVFWIALICWIQVVNATVSCPKNTS